MQCNAMLILAIYSIQLCTLLPRLYGVSNTYVVLLPSRYTVRDRSVGLESAPLIRQRVAGQG